LKIIIAENFTGLLSYVKIFALHKSGPFWACKMSLGILHSRARMSIRTLIRRWVARNRQVFSPGTCKVYSGAIWRFADFIPTDIRNLQVEHIERYVAHLLEKEGLKRRSVNSHIGVIKSFCKWCSETFEIQNEAVKIKVLKYDPPKRRFINEEEYQKVLAVCSDGEGRVIKLLYHTGLRAAELQSLQLSNIHDRSIRFSGKGRKERTVPLNQTAYDCIYQNGKPNIKFLESYRSRNKLYALCRRLSIRAGIPVAGPHAYRRVFGNQLRNKGVDIYKISKLYGHAEIKTTELYLAERPDELKGLTDCLDK